MLEAGKFSIDDSAIFEGYHNPEIKWNGFAVPLFLLSEAVKIARWVNEANGDETMVIDIRKQTITFNEGYETPTIIKPEFYETRIGGLQKLYGVGAGWWVWWLEEEED
jgi:hypothetical protein